MVILQTLVYACFYPIERVILRTPLIGPLFRLLLMIYIDFPKLYAIIGVWSWLASGKPDYSLAGIMPKDPYLP